MAESDVTGGDLYHLWRVSDVHLPRIADVYYDATRLIGGAESTVVSGATWNGHGYDGPQVSHDTDAYRAGTPAYPGAGFMVSAAGGAWAGLRDELQSMYAQIGATVLTAADAVRRATQDFVDADQVNADKLNTYKNDPANHNQDDPASNPPAPGSAEDPGQPDLPPGAGGQPS